MIITSKHSETRSFSCTTETVTQFSMRGKAGAAPRPDAGGGRPHHGGKRKAPFCDRGIRAAVSGSFLATAVPERRFRFSIKTRGLNTEAIGDTAG